jgi:ferredoxin-NADP reductase
LTSSFQTFTARVKRSVWLSEGTRHLEFEMLGEKHFGFVPGQWLSFKQAKPDGEEITRAYSIASSSERSPRFAFCLNRGQDGFMSNFLCDMKEGQEISC